MRNLLLGSLDRQPRNDAWVKRLKRYRRSWLMLMGLIIVLIMFLEIQQNFRINPLVLFGAAAIGLLTFIVSEGIDSRIQIYESDQLLNQVSEEEAKARWASIGFGDERRKQDEDD